MVFEHDGRPFEPRDIYAITNIGEGTKAADDDKIGRFGVGFKAVFAYTETPHIWSTNFSFQITELVLPWELAPARDLGRRTRFEFPFNNPKKTADHAFHEVKQGLRELAEMTLLFLPHLLSVGWQIENGITEKIARDEHPDNHVEVLKQSEGTTTGSSHFLKFDRPVEGLEKQRVAVAFELDFLPNVRGFDSTKPLAKQVKIISAHPGQVAVFFPADKEPSGLRFHLHAPFVPEINRASIKDTAANLPLFTQLAKLAAASLHQIRDLGLLTVDFLEVLPNNKDPINDRYALIRAAIIDEMNNQPLTPTQSRSHAPAKHLIQGKASLKKLLTDEDLKFLLDYDHEAFRWVAGVTQKNNNQDRFLESLALTKYDVDEFALLLRNKASSVNQTGPPKNISSQQFMGWLSKRPVEWHQEMYALLLTDHLLTAGNRRDFFKARLKQLNIVRLTDGSYKVGGLSFFLGEGAEHEEGLHLVDAGVYNTGKSETEKQNARAFLQEIGVREIGEAELVEAILKRRYRKGIESRNETTYKHDLKRFVELVEKDPEQAGLFSDYYILQCGATWRKPVEVFLDRPLLDTGLSFYYLANGVPIERFPLSDRYQNCGIPTKQLVRFVLACGAVGSLAIQNTSCSSNPDAKKLVEASPVYKTQFGIDSDHYIPRLEGLLEKPTAGLAQLVWMTLCAQKDDSWTTAQYRNNSKSPIQRAPSQLIHVLRNKAWIPQTDDRFVRPAEATRDGLPAGFAFDPGWTWLQAIQFGQELANKSAEQRQQRTLAKQLGFDDEESLDRAKRFVALPADEQRRILVDRERKAPVALPEHVPSNPSRRAEKLAAQASKAPERLSEERTRSVPVGLDTVKEEAGGYLRQQYTNADGQMICQVCKNQLPFKLEDGKDYFERVEFLRGLKRRHAENYLALCPNHAAMFLHANGSTDELHNRVIAMVGNYLEVILARTATTIYFTKTHVADLKTLITVD